MYVDIFNIIDLPILKPDETISSNYINGIDK